MATVNLAQLVANRATADIDMGGGIVHIEFYPARITTAMLLNYAAMQNTGSMTDMPTEQAMAIIESPTNLLPQVLASWNLIATNADGVDEPLPCDAEHIQALGIQLQWRLFRGIFESQQQSASGEAPASAGGVSAPTSDATSPQTAQ